MLFCEIFNFFNFFNFLTFFVKKNINYHISRHVLLCVNLWNFLFFNAKKKCHISGLGRVTCQHIIGCFQFGPCEYYFV